MDQSAITEHDCNVLGGLFQIIVTDLKNGHSTWEDFVFKATKFQSQLKTTIASSTAFLDAFQKVADIATTTRGGTKEIGTALTRLCLRHRSVEAKLKSFSSAILDCLITPLQDRIEEWKKATIILDKDHTKELKRFRQEFKKRQVCDSLATSSSFRGKKHSSRMGKSKYDFIESLSTKGIYGTIGSFNKSSSPNLSRSLDSEMECNEKLMMFEELEKKAVRRALIEERSRFCVFVSCLQPVIEEEISMIQEISHIQEIMDSLFKLTIEPYDLPPSSEDVISRLKLNKHETSALNFQTPPSSPSSLGSRKSSMCSISSYNSSSSSSTYGQTGQNKYLSLTNIPASSYGNVKYSQSNQPDNVCIKNSELSTNFSYVKKKCKNENNNVYSCAYDSNELQFKLETDSGSKQQPSKPNTIMISSTNPFLNSYNHVADDDNYQSTNSATNHLYSLSAQSIDLNINSEGSITPTNYEQTNLDMSIAENEQKSVKSAKPPPAPPVRRTSSISNPNAITIGTLKNAGIGNNYDNLCANFSLYDEINVLTKSMNDINFTLKNTDFINSQSPSTPMSGDKLYDYKNERIAKANDNFAFYDMDNQSTNNNSESNDKKQHQIVKNISESSNNSKSFEEDASQLPLPAPPPEAFMDTPTVTNITTSTISHPHYNKITNVHREFLETLNSKLSQSPLVHHQPTKRRNSSQSSIEGPLSNCAKARTSTRSSSTTRSSSRKNSFESSNSRGNFIENLSHSLMHKQQNIELAKAAASNALQRKQSVPDLNELNSNLRQQNRVTFSSSLNLSSPGQSFQVVQIQTNPTQQPIYASRTQLRREIEEMYGTLGGSLYGTTGDSSSYQNGFFNKI